MRMLPAIRFQLRNVFESPRYLAAVALAAIGIAVVFAEGLLRFWGGWAIMKACIRISGSICLVSLFRRLAAWLQEIPSAAIFALEDTQRWQQGWAGEPISLPSFWQHSLDASSM